MAPDTRRPRSRSTAARIECLHGPQTHAASSQPPRFLDTPVSPSPLLSEHYFSLGGHVVHFRWSQMYKAIDVRSKISHFRILIIGRANAGKTTILKKMCNSVEDPEIYDPSGDKIDPEIVKESAERGLHDIDNQLIFKSNPQLVFHDSRGFEGGSADEIQKVTDFIEYRAKTNELSKQLHAIWYCLPTDGNRPLLEAEDQFFKISGTGKGKVHFFLALAAAFDGLVTKAFQQLRAEGKNIRTANAGKVELAQRMLTTNYRDQLNEAEFKPSAYVQLDGDMRLEHSNCIELINETAKTLTDDALLLLFVSVQRNNIDLCIWLAVPL
ncbi:GTP-binding protein [Mycena sanguinolenta]|uniref:GTP-binding protein n=1 Tax=Mycena sanguinolenta TaxID=230812 RepID=A0A8H6XNM2_9AGAR|nr:GTP-binding protein [Mycena sanguinolenta]